MEFNIHPLLLYPGALVLLASLMPLVRHDFWIFRVFEYPRLQKLTINVLLVIALLIFQFPVTTSESIFAGLIVLNLGYLIWQVYPFTPLAKKQIITSRQQAGERNLSMLIANVYQENRRAADYISLIRKYSPDLVLMVETNQWWMQQMEEITESYPHQVKVPLENTYGMMLYSRLPLKENEIHYLVAADIPSIETLVQIPSGDWLRVYCLHPEPPVPQENPRSTERDKEILIVAKKAKASTIPVVVAGDLNDVAWSYTTDLFLKISGLLDPRRGRGFFNSFNAKYLFLRFPLDHIFCSSEFTLSTIKRLPSCGSDHFPMFVNLQLDPASSHQNQELEADEADQELADEKINAAS